MISKRIKTLCWMSALSMAALLTVTLAQRPASNPGSNDDDPSGRVARLNYVKGPVSFQPAGEPDWVSANVNWPITTGDRLWTEAGSRAEMHLGSSTIRLGDKTGMSFFNLDDRTTQIELSAGILNVRVLRLDRDETFEIDTPNQAFTILRPGQYRVEASEDGINTFVSVRSGEGEVTGGGRTYTVGAGLTGSFSGSDSLRASIYKSSAGDEFDRWSQDRDRRDDTSQSARYVSPDLVGYQDLDDYGTWRVDVVYGNVWTPRVASGWAPYHDGHWVWISPWGWTWVDDAPWGYAPFHYGRWVNTGNNWGWVPGPVAVRPVYAPALVVFVGGPSFGISVSIGGGRSGGNVGWFPLGPREVYVPSYRTSRAYVDRVNVSNTTVNNITITNVYNNTTNTNINYANRSVRGGVTAVPQNAFVNSQPVGRAAVAVNPQELAKATISRRAEVAPTRNSVLGPAAAGSVRVAQPSAAVANRAVVAKTPPPPQPIPFEKQQTKLAAQPGQPLAKSEVEVLRPTNIPAARTRVKQAPPGKPAIAESTPTPAPNPAAGNAGRGANRGQQPAASTPPPSPSTRAPAPTPVPAPVPAPASPTDRTDRPPTRGSRGPQPATSAPPSTPSTAPTPVPAPAPANPTDRTDRPPTRGSRGPQPAASTPQPTTPASAPAPAPANPTDRTDRPSNRGDRGQQPAAPAPPSTPARSAPAPAANADSPAGNNATGSRGRGRAAPAQEPETKVAAPATSNSAGGR